MHGSRLKQLRRATVALAVAAALTVGAGCGDDDGSSSGGKGEVAELRMGIQPWIGYGPWWIVDAKGFDRDHGVDVKLTNFKADTEMNAAFVGGRIDAENLITETAVNFLAEDVPMRIALLEDVSQSADGIIAGPGVDSIEDLRGKQVAFELGAGGSNLMVDFPLFQAGMTRDDIDHVELPAADAGAAILAGRVDAGSTYEPYLSEALSRGADKGLHVIFKAGNNPGMISDVLAVNEEYASGNGDAVAAALRAWNDAIEFYRSNTEAAQAIIADKVGAEPESLRTAFEGIELFDLEQSQEQLEGAYPALAKDIVATLQKCCEYDADPDIEGAIDTSFGTQALAGAQK